MKRELTELSLVAEIGLTEIDGAPRVYDLDLAERLGFNRPRAIRDLIGRSLNELMDLSGGRRTVRRVTPGRGKQPDQVEYWLTEEEAILIAAKSDAPKAPAVRAMLIKVFVAWRRGHLGGDVSSIFQELAHMRANLADAVKTIVHQEIAAILPAMVSAQIASAQYEVVRGMTAGKAIELAGVKDKRGTKGLAQIVSNALRRYHAGKGVTVKLAELGMHTAYVFDPATVREWLANGGKESILARVAEKRGQGVLQLVSG